MAYLLDANVFIQAKRLHYGMDFCPAFWRWLEQENVAGRVFSIEKVADELNPAPTNSQSGPQGEVSGSSFLPTPRCSRR